MKKGEARHMVVHCVAPDWRRDQAVDDVCVLEPGPVARSILPLRVNENLSERAYVQAVRCLYVRSPLASAVVVRIQGLTQEPISFAVAPHEHGARSERDALLHVPAVARDLPLLPMERYLGMEGAISSRRSSAVLDASLQAPLPKSDYDVFAEGDPLLTFLMEQRHFFPGVREQDVVLLPERVRTLDERRCYMVNRDTAERVARFVERNVAPLIEYAPAHEAQVTVEASDGPWQEPLVLVLAVDYVVVGPRAPQLQTHSWRLF